MKLFFGYLKQYRAALVCYFVSFFILVLSFYLYKLPMRAVLYPLLLCGVFGLLLLISGFLKFRVRHKALIGMADAGAALLSELPDAETVFDADYQRLITALRNECCSLSENAAQRYSDMEEYYTLWVHQIKTPIASMRLCLQGEDSAAARRLGADLMRIEQYVDMVLVYLRLDGDGSDYVFSDCELDDILRHSLRRFSPEFIDRKLSLSFEPTEKRIVTDEKWLGFVIEQLLSNALKYTQSGGIRLYLADENTLNIEDSGIGISPDDLPRIFERGYTGRNGRSDMKASGIGLYLCGRICANLGIAISASSVVGKGTVMSLDLKQHRVSE